MSDRYAPPSAPRRLLERTVPPGTARDGLVGDLHEMYEERRRARGRLGADLWYWRAAFRYWVARGHSRVHPAEALRGS